jgi:hypothetical protein
MSMVSQPISGAAAVSSAYTSQYAQFTIATGTALQYNELICNGLPSVFIYVRQTAGANGCIFQPVFAVQNTAAAVPDWLPYNGGAVVALTVPVYFNVRSSVALIAAQITNNTGVNCTFDVVVAASS